MRASGSILCSLVAAAYLAAHLPFLAPSLEDIDSINFALGLREFDVARHQPHPPGYPVYVALGRVSRGAMAWVAPDLPRVRAEAWALAVWSAIAGAIAILAAGALFRGVETNRSRVRLKPDATLDEVRLKPDTTLDEVRLKPDTTTGGVLLKPDTTSGWATVLLALAPLFWISGLRPMSDLPGLAVALSAQALLVSSWSHPRYLLPAALLTGIAIGLRVQTLWLTVPLLVVTTYVHRRAGARWLARPAAAAGAGVLLWAVPLLIASGGPGGYWRALGSQAGEDFAWVDMLWANPTPRRIAAGLYETFVMPWGSIPLAVAIGVVAGAGALVAVMRMPRTLALIGVAFVPYGLFHLLFQETAHVRYALPLVVPVAWLAGHAITATQRAAPVLGAALCLLAAWTALPGMFAYASEAHPAFRAIDDMSAAAREQRPAALFAHYSLRRPLQAALPAHVAVVEPPRTNEWIGPVTYWRGGGTAPIWFLADPRRTDLATIDPVSRRTVRRYRWRAAERLELSGARPMAADWYRFSRPGWFAGTGWSLTPELGGMTRLAGNGVDQGPIEAHVLRRPDATVAIVGARYLGSAADGAVVFALAIDGRQLAEWTLDPAEGPNVLRVLHFPAGTLEGTGAYARLSISARAAQPGRRTPAVAIRQFDIQSISGLVFAFDEGWHEDEYDNATGLRWRWTSGRSVVRVIPPQAVRVTLRGESPLQYFPAPPTVRISAGERVIATRQPDSDFDWTIDVAAEEMLASDGRIAIETDPVYLPGVVEGTADERQLGLRLFEIDVIPSSRD